MRSKSSTSESDGASKPSEKTKPFEHRSGEPKGDEKPKSEKSAGNEDSKHQKSDKVSSTERDMEKKSEPTESVDSKSDLASGDEGKTDIGKSEGDQQKESSESSEKKDD
jgi:hypothetical protein